MRYEVWIYETWGSKYYSFTVNDRFKHPEVMEIASDTDDAMIVGWLKKQGILGPNVKEDELNFDGDDYLIFVEDAVTGRPLFRLEQIID